MPYQLSIALGSILYAMAGLWFLRKVLLHFFDDKIVALVMIVIVLGTNYLHLSAFDRMMPHNYLFTIYVLITWLTIRWHNDPGWKFAIPLGLLCGLATLVRPTAGVIVLVPLLWGAWGSLELKKIGALLPATFRRS